VLKETTGAFNATRTLGWPVTWLVQS